MSTTAPEKAAPRPRGRPRKAPADLSDKTPRTIRLGAAHWAALQSLGTAWLERAIDRAMRRTPE